MIKLNKVCFSYDGEHPVLVDFCMEIPDGGAIAVMGASGSGKTTLLRILLGLEKPNSGEILGLNNKRFAVVFQEDRLLQHRTARQNVEIPLIGTQIEKTNVHKIADASNGTRSMVRSMMSAMAVKEHSPRRNPSFTISLAAFTMHGMLPPRRIDSNAMARQRNLSRSGSKNSRGPRNRSRRSPESGSRSG